MVLYLHAPKPPNMVISESSINLTVPAYVNMSVIDPSSNQTKPACTLNVVSVNSIEEINFLIIMCSWCIVQ